MKQKNHILIFTTLLHTIWERKLNNKGRKTYYYGIHHHTLSSSFMSTCFVYTRSSLKLQFHYYPKNKLLMNLIYKKSIKITNNKLLLSKKKAKIFWWETPVLRLLQVFKFLIIQSNHEYKIWNMMLNQIITGNWKWNDC